MTGVPSVEINEIPFSRPKAYDLGDVNVSVGWGWKKLLERVVLGHWGWFGYRNSVSTKLRGLAALVQTIYATMGLWVLCIASAWVLRKGDIEIAQWKDGIDQQALVTIIAMVAAVFGGTWWREKKDIHEKWLYLAGLYNQMVVIDPASGRGYNKREYLRVALAHDLLILEMWAHRSFADLFKEVLERAVCYDSGYSSESASRKLEQVAKGISYSEANRLICAYMGSLSPSSDSVKFYFILKNRSVDDLPSG